MKMLVAGHKPAVGKPYCTFKLTKIDSTRYLSTVNINWTAMDVSNKVCKSTFLEYEVYVILLLIYVVKNN